MANLYFSNRDSLQCVDVEFIAIVKAEGNYSRVYYINQHEILLTYGIGKMVEILSEKKGDNCHFVRLGRSIIVNHAYLHKIDLQKQILELSNHGRNVVRINLSKNVLKSYKEAVEKSVLMKKQKIVCE